MTCKIANAYRDYCQMHGQRPTIAGLLIWWAGDQADMARDYLSLCEAHIDPPWRPSPRGLSGYLRKVAKTREKWLA